MSRIRAIGTCAQPVSNLPNGAGYEPGLYVALAGALGTSKRQFCHFIYVT